MDIRDARQSDLDVLVALENAVFDSDRLSRRSFQRFIQQGRSALRVAEEEGRLLGYVLVIFRRGTSLARLYSMAVASDAQGRGLGRRLLVDGEQQAVENGCVAMRLEVREDNASAITLYQSAGYQPFGRYPDYYEDHADALRMEKSLADVIRPPHSSVPWYGQTLEFTCGPAALMMALASLNASQPLNRNEEIRLWREATTVFMTSGHGGCGPFGLAVAAAHRGHAVELWTDGPRPFFVDSVRDEEKKAVIEMVEADFQRELERLDVPMHHGWPGVEVLQKSLARGWRALVLISSWRIWNEKSPHWVVVTGYSEPFFFVHDPWDTNLKSRSNARWRPGDRDRLDGIDMPIPSGEFERMSRYGRSAQRAVILLGPLS
ncbi:GNAT family N-acetyltransferase/peptidase C39 family protein [Natronospira bacteriovora]|uniref:GNAT family N-acetyltransferase/peptidase C39 family protein n=1 Tax=Natronospira bacteriovora TaxID=3069753 RepID=A0ABU0W965_9GAMM|nr:GNAT family N-acetyltransferase/peptidase C39 family protein [Natronospira sp. AB-CW4]MDQ2070303.1 GNAT family N-acetyltransferase/peptidase C39 family protein [Natronospira sp. AB-CW4]